jgi:hypothetical protein
MSITITRLVAGKEQAAIDTGAAILGVRASLADGWVSPKQAEVLRAVQDVRRLCGWQQTYRRVLAGYRFDVARLIPGILNTGLNPHWFARLDGTQTSEALQEWTTAGWHVGRPDVWDSEAEGEIWRVGSGQPVPYCYADSATRTLRIVGYALDLTRPIVRAFIGPWLLRAVRQSHADGLFTEWHRDFFEHPQTTRLRPDVLATYEAPITDTPYQWADAYSLCVAAVIAPLQTHEVAVIARDYPPAGKDRGEGLEGAPVIGWAHKVV